MSVVGFVNDRLFDEQQIQMIGDDLLRRADERGRRTGTALAGRAHESRESSAMPVLADALHDAGCGSDDLLNRLRPGRPHVRECWVLDLVLGKS